MFKSIAPRQLFSVSFPGNSADNEQFSGQPTVRENIGHPGIRKGGDITHKVVIEELMSKAVLIPF